MYHGILVPLDGSPLAERVLPYAVQLARRSAACMLLVHAYVELLAERVDPFAAIEPVNSSALVTASGVAHAPDPIAAYLDAWVSRLAERSLAAEALLVHGHAGNAIVQAAQEQGADLIAMSTHGRSGLGRWLYGSVADHVLRHARVPVLLVSAGCTRVWDVVPGQPVLVPLDGSELAEAALFPAIQLAQVLATGLVLVQAVEPPLYPAPDLYSAADFDPAPLLAAARDYLEHVAAGLREQGYDVATQAEVGRTFSVITAAARERGASVIAMATHGRTGLARVVLGSVATAVLQHTEVPLLLIRPPAVHERESPPAPEAYDDAGDGTVTSPVVPPASPASPA